MLLSAAPIRQSFSFFHAWCKSMRLSYEHEFYQNDHQLVYWGKRCDEMSQNFLGKSITVYNDGMVHHKPEGVSYLFSVNTFKTNAISQYRIQ